MPDEFGEGDLFDRYGARRMQLHLAVGQLIANSVEHITDKVVDRIIEKEVDPVSVDLVNDMTVEFCTELFAWHNGQNPLPEPVIRYVDEDGNEIEGDLDIEVELEEEEYEEPRRIGLLEFIRSWLPQKNG